MPTPRELARLMELIAEGKVVSRAAGDEMIALLRQQQFRTMIPRRLPEDDAIKVADKPGWDEEKLDNEALLAGADVARMIHDHFDTPSPARG